MVTVLGGQNGPLGRRRGASCPDFFCYLAEANKASLVMLREEGLVNRRQAEKIAGGIVELNAEQQAPGAARTANYLNFEQRLIELADQSVSNLHLGRSVRTCTASCAACWCATGGWR